MNRMLILITILLLAINVYGQHLRFDDPAIITDTIRSAVHKGFVDNRYDYSFKANGLLYVLSYRPNDGKDWNSPESGMGYRDLILYRMDGIDNWIQASDIVQSDFQFSSTHEEYFSKLQYISYCDYGKVLQLKSGCILMFLSNIYALSKEYWNLYHYNTVVVFIPNGDRTYCAIRFEPVNKKTKQPEISANDTLKVYEYDNEIRLELWNKIVCKENEKPDGFVKNDSDASGNEYKIYYKRELTGKLDFEINGKKVYYYGTYKMTSSK